MSIVKTLWKLAAAKMVLFSISSLWICWATATSNLDMPALGWWDWFQTIGGCFAAWCLTMMAFIDKSAVQISSGQIPGLDLEATKKEQLKETTV